MNGKLGLNQGGYAGEKIDIEQVVQRALLAAASHGWSADRFSPDGCPSIYALRRGPTDAEARVYISAGIHGDEPAGPCAVVELIEEDRFPEQFSYWICPCLNPWGCESNRRENPQGIDLNRDYHRPVASEVQSHIAWLEVQPRFDVAFCLHEDWESDGFYIYELNLDSRPSLAEGMIDAVSMVCPVDLASEIEGRPAVGGIIRPNHDPLSRPQWPEAFYLTQKKTRQSYTLEAPSDFPLSVRVAALKAATSEALRKLGQWGVVRS